MFCEEKGSTEQVVPAARGAAIHDWEKHELQTSKTKKPNFPCWCICRFEECSSIFCSLYSLLHLIQEQESDKPDIMQNNGKYICHKEKDKCMWWRVSRNRKERRLQRPQVTQNLLNYLHFWALNTARYDLE